MRNTRQPRKAAHPVRNFFLRIIIGVALFFVIYAIVMAVGANFTRGMTQTIAQHQQGK